MVSVYLASSLKNTALLAKITLELRGLGFQVCNPVEEGPPGAADGRDLPGLSSVRASVFLHDAEAVSLFEHLRAKIEEAELFVLVHPCGDDSHVELGRAQALRKPCLMLRLTSPEAPLGSLNYMGFERVCSSLDDLAEALGVLAVGLS